VTGHAGSSTVASIFLTCFFGCLLLPASVHGEAFRILDQGAAATAQGGAFAAQADDPSALYYNPAGMTQLSGVQIYSGALLVSGRITFTAPDGTVVHGGTTGTVANPPPSTFYLTAKLKDLGVDALGNLTVGLGVLSPFGLLVKYPSTSVLSTVTTYAALPLLDIKPTLAYQVTNYLSLGAGMDIYTFSSLIGDGHAEEKLVAGPQFALLGITPGTQLEVNGTDTAVGFNLSLLATPLRNASGKPLLNFGLVYRSPVTLGLNGHFIIDRAHEIDSEIHLKLPWVLTGAIAGWPLRDEQREWKLEVDVDYVDWTSFNNLDLKLSNGVTLPARRDWGVGYVVMAGSEYRWLSIAGLPGWEVAARGGYVRSATPVPSRTFDPTVPDSNYNAFSIGMGWLCRRPGSFLGVLPCGDEQGRWWLPKAIGLDLAYQAVLYDSRKINNNIDPRVNGQWENTVHVGSLSLNVRF
jgi:long-chain fatty acid transport protein